MRPRLSPREGPGQEVWILAGKSVSAHKEN